MIAKPLAHLPNLVDLMLDAVFMVDADGYVVYVSAACERIFGYRPDEMMGRKLFDFLHPEDRERTIEEAAKVMSGQPRIGFENRYVRKDGSLVNVMWSASWSEADRLRIGVARDVSERKRAETMQAALYAISEAVHATSNVDALCSDIHRIVAQLIPVADFAISTLDAQTGEFGFRFHRPSDSFLVREPCVRRVCEEVIAKRHARQGSGSDSAAETPASWLAVPLIVQKRAIGALIVKSHPGTFYQKQDMELLLFVSEQIATAIERKRLLGKLQRMAQYDELTGLPNRRLLKDRMDMALARARRQRSRMAVLYVDMDDFKLVNDRHGHATGDLLLKEVAHRLQQSVRACDIVARVGGDEFVVLLEHISSMDDARAVGEKIGSTVSEKIVIDDTAISVLTSVGCALYPDDGEDLDQLLRHADKSMYSAKRVKTTG